MTDSVALGVEAALDALGRGDLAEASDRCRQGLEIHDAGELHRILGDIAYADDRLPDARDAWEAAYRAFARDGPTNRAARMATLLGELYWGGLGKEATGRGWLERAKRLLEPIGPCVEWGYWELARLACDRPDMEELSVCAQQALDIAAAFGDTGLHVRALVDSGVALVSSGAVSQGLARLDEALACIAAGEVTDLFIVGTSFCGLLTAAERIGDVDRVTEWVEAVATMLLDRTGGRPGVLRSHCSIALGGVLVQAGRWAEAEKLLQASLADGGSSRLGHRIDALARLADLRLHQGRVDEAFELLVPFEDHVAVSAPLAALHLQADQPALAAAVARRAVEQMVGDALCVAPLLLVLTDAELRQGNLDIAAEVAHRLQALAATSELNQIVAIAAIAEGRVATAGGEHDRSIAAFDNAIRLLADGDHPHLQATAHLDLAAVHEAKGDRSAAIAAARAAHACAQRLDAAPLRDRAASMMRGLGVAPPRSAAVRDEMLADLTVREREVLHGLRRGETNAEIAGRLYLSPKTVEHHVSRLLSKLGARSRAEAAAIAAAAEQR